jgi:hypothetical protein
VAQTCSTRYLRWLVVTVLTGIVVAVGTIVLVDPYGLYGVVNAPGFNEIKPRLARYQNETKLTHARRTNPEAVILGNSRAEIGFDPEAQVFTQAGITAYNLAIPGSAIVTARQQLGYLHRVGVVPKSALIGLEFLDFVGTPAMPGVRRIERPSVDREHAVDRWGWRVDTLFSLTSLNDAFRTLRIQRDSDAEVTTTRGFNPLNEYRPLARNEGYYALFRQRAQQNAGTYTRLAGGSLLPERLAELRAMLDVAAEQGTDVTLAIYPYHAQILAMFEVAGLAAMFDEWKSRVVEEIAAVQENHPGARLVLADLSGYGPYQCEPIPQRGDRTTDTRWYWEAGHFKKELGEVVLEAMSASRTGRAAEVVDATIRGPEGTVGMWLDNSTLDANRERIVSERAACASAVPEIFADARSMIAAARKSAPAVAR